MSIVMFLTIAYGIIFIITLFVPSEFIAIAFDASGATTGALAVPFILAMSLGISSLKKDSKASEEDSFGLVALVSTGAIMSVLIMGLIKDITNITGTPPKVFDDTGQIITPFLHSIPESFSDSFIAIAPICVIYIILQIFAFKFPRRVFAKIFKGLLYTMLGLTLFITGVNTGFMNVGTSLGQWIGQHKIFTVLLGLLIGVVTILAEPAVHVLTQQIETVTAGYVKRKIIMIALAIGVGIAVALSIIRILVPSLKLWHYLLPGYIVAIALSFAAPKLFVGIAFDSGGVASGPMTATFILAFSQGVASVSGSDLLNDAFGMIALVAMTPIIMIELVGLLYKLKTRKNLRGE
jgi:hypothetical protein